MSARNFFDCNRTPADQHNGRAWDAMVRRGHRFAQPASDADFVRPLAAVDGDGWLGASVRGLSVLCLAAGGGRHGPLLAAAGADVTVVDLSDAQLHIDREVAQQRGLRLRTVEASLQDLSMLPPAAFDCVLQPVSTCYVADVRRVWSEVARVIRGGALYISQHKTPTSLQLARNCGEAGYALVEPYYGRGPLQPEVECRHREAGTIEYLHRWGELLGGLCRAGFVIEDVREPMHADHAAPPGSFAHRSVYAAPYVRIKARRRLAASPGSTVWLPATAAPR
jgi:SAM-dependent methyltransferase